MLVTQTRENISAATPRPVVSVVLDALAIVNEILVVLAIGADLLLTLVNVGLRYLFSISLVWTTDVYSILFNAIVFLGAAAAFRRGLDLRFTYVLERMEPRYQPVVSALGLWLIAALATLTLLAFPGYYRDALSHNMTTIPVSDALLACWMGVGYALLFIYVLERIFKLQPQAVLLGFLGVVILTAIVLARSSFAPGSGLADPIWPAFILLAIAFVTGVPIALVLGVTGAAFLSMIGGHVFLDVPATFQQGISSYVLQAIPFFMIAGVLMLITGMARRLVDMMAAWVGHWPAGLLITQVAAMYVFSGLSGSKTADVAAVGTVMSRSLKERGYPPAESVATLAAGGAMGETIPPSIAILVLASVSTISVGSLFLAGLLPAFVLAIAIVIGILYRSRGGRLPRGDAFNLRAALGRTRDAIPALVMPLVIVCGIVFGIGTPTEVSSFAVLYGIVASAAVYRSLSLRPLWEVLRDAALLSGAVLLILSCASLLSEAITFDGIPQQIVTTMSGSSQTFFWISSAVGLVIAGSILEGMAGLIIFAPLLIPISASFGISPLHYGIVLLIAMGIGSFAPPIGVGLYIACAAGGVSVDETMRPSAFYTLVLLIGLAVIIAFPPITLAVPHWLGFH